MAKITIDGKEYEIEQGIPLIQACEKAGIEIPRFCYHDRLRIAGNCRMCLVEVRGAPKPVASCAATTMDGMVVNTNSELVKKAREGVMEFLLVNHPLDCPICDQGGECDLQDQAFKYGKGNNRYQDNKRSVKDKYMGPLIKTHMTRCIHCTRCVRFMNDVAGVEELGAINRGEEMAITTYIEKGISSNLSGNIIDLCPVGALNSKPYSHTARSWELKKTKSIDVFDAMGCNISISSRGLEVMRILPSVCEQINEEWISDKTRFSYDGLKNQRIDRPYIKDNGKLMASSLDSALRVLSDKVKVSDPKKIAVISGDMTDCESMLSFKIMLDKLGCNNYSFNQESHYFDTSNRENYLFNSLYSGLEKADFVLLVGADIKNNAPVLSARISKLQKFNNLKVARIGEGNDQTFDSIDLGDNVSAISDILSENHKFTKQLNQFKNPIIIVGDEIYSRNDAPALMQKLEDLAKKFGFIKNGWNGFSTLLNNASTTGALDLEFYSKDLPVNFAKKLDKGDIELLILLGADDINIPQNHKGMVVYIGHHGDKSANIADVIIPSPAFSEKTATYVNNEGKVQKTRMAVPRIGNAIHEAEIVLELSKLLSIDLGFESLSDISKKVISIIESKKRGSLNFQKTDVKIKDTIIKSKKTNFYYSNVISRASKTMSECTKEFCIDAKEDLR